MSVYRCALAVLSFAFGSATAAADVFRCTENGKTVYRDTPCTQAATPSEPAAASKSYDSPYGTWRGQTQYQAKIRSESDPAAHAVINLVLSIEPGGKLVGRNLENGCQMLGIAAPGVAPHIVTLNVTLTGCAYSRFNRSYTGHLSVHTQKQFAALSLLAVSMTPGQPGTYTIQATTMRR